MTPLPCGGPLGNVNVFCTPGSAAPQPVQAGYYSDVAVGVTVINASLMSRQVECPPGYYCVGGVRLGCPAGRYQDQVGRADMGDCIVCTPGFYCGTDD